MSSILVLSFVAFSQNPADLNSDEVLSTSPEKNIYVGVGTQVSEYTNALSLKAQFRPQSPKLVTPYVDGNLSVSFGPSDTFKEQIATINDSQNSADMDLSWNTYTFDSHIGFEIKGPKDNFFIRTGGALNLSLSPNMYEEIAEKASLEIDFTSIIRSGVFASIGTQVDLQQVQWLPTLTLGHTQGITTGGGSLSIADSSHSLESLNQKMDTDFTHASFSNDISYAKIENYIHTKEISFHIEATAGVSHASEFTQYKMETEGIEDPYNREFWNLNVGVGRRF